MIAGHRRIIRYFERVLARGTLAHAYLFHGPEEVGKKTVAMALARSLFCSDQPQAVGGCGQCEDCGLVARSAHPDLLSLSFAQPLVAGGNKREIGIENVHELQRRLALAPWRGGRKVAVIDGADSLSRDAQGALLKTIEEPDARSVFFLITSAPGDLLATIRSRSVEVGFTGLGEEDMAGLASLLPPSRRAEAIRLAAGKPGRLVRFTGDRALAEEYAATERRMSALARANLAEQFHFSDENARETGALEPLFDFLIRALRADLHAVIRAPSADAAAPARLAAFLHVLLERMLLVRATAVNRRLVADSVFFDLAMISPAERP